MNDTGLKLKDTLAKIDQRINNLAEAKGMTYDEFYDWSDRETDRQEITNDEFLLITAYQLDKAIENIKDFRQRQEIDSGIWWRKRFYDDFDKVDTAIKHLTEVCSYVKDRYKVDYHYEYLLTLDEAMYETLTEIHANKTKRGRSNLKYED